MNPSLIIVKNLRAACITDAEKLLYDQLQAESFYPTPHYLVAGVKMNLALVPYRLALIELNGKIDQERLTKILKKHHWDVLFYDAEQVMKHEDSYMNHILQHTKMYQTSEKVVY